MHNRPYRRVTSWIALSLVWLMAAHAYGQNPQERPLRVGVYQNEPKVFRDADGNASGLFIDVLEAIAAEEGWALEYVDCPWNTCLDMLESGKLDLMPDMAFSRDRDQRFAFHDIPVVDSFSRFYAPEGSSIQTLADLAGKRIAVLDESSQEAELEQVRDRIGGSLTLVRTPSFDEAFRSVEIGDADAVVSNQFFGDQAASEYGLKHTPVVIQPASLYFAAPVGTYTDELATIDHHLDAWQSRAASPYNAALRKWTTTRPSRTVPEWVWYATYAALGVLFLAGLLIVVLRKQVAARTRHLDERNQELRKNQRHLNLIVDHGPDLVLHVDTDGRIIFVNRVLSEITGHQPGDLKGRALLDLFPDDIDEDLRERLSSESLETGVFRTELRHVDGHLVPVEVRRGAIPDDDGEPWLCQFIVRDLSERADLQRKLQLAQRLETAGMLAGGVAHDFNNLLTIINASARLAMDELDEDCPVYEDLHNILDAGERAAGITRQLLAFSRQSVIVPKLIKLSETVGQLVDMLHHFLEESISLEVDLDDEEAWVLLDPAQVEQIVLNLVINARDAIERHGTVRIATRLDAEARRVVLEVEDTGRGMDEKTLERVFEPFFTTKAPDEGTGLGLATVYGIVTRADGEIDIESTPGEGTEFTISFPVADPDNGRLEAATSSDRHIANGERILVVEDEGPVRRVVERMLRRAGFEVTSAESVDDAIELLREDSEFALLLTDVIMPDHSGAELVQRVRSEYPHMSTLYMSGYTSDKLDEHGVDDEEIALVRKPFSPDELTSRVLQVLNEAR